MRSSEKGTPCSFGASPWADAVMAEHYRDGL